MKVVHICSSMTGGAGAAAFRLHRALCSSGIDSVMLTMHDDKEELRVHRLQRPMLYRILGRLPFIGQRKYLAYLHKYDDVTQAMTFPDALYDCSQIPLLQSADVINLHWVGNMLNYESFFANVRKPIVWTLHDMNPFMGALHFASDMEKIADDESAMRLERKIRENKEHAYKNVSNLTIAPLCQWMKGESAASAAFSGRPHTIVRNCVDVGVFSPISKEVARKSLGLPLNSTLILYVCQHVKNPRKGYDVLRSAVNQFPEECNLVAVGNGAIDGSGRVINIGRVEDAMKMAAFYAAADALILPSLEDNLPNTMVESLCCGTPVLAFSQGGMKDIIKNGFNGLLSRQMSSDGLCEIVRLFCENGVSWDVNTISRDAKSQFSPDAVARQYMDIYNRIVKCDD